MHSYKVVVEVVSKFLAIVHAPNKDMAEKIILNDELECPTEISRDIKIYSSTKINDMEQ